MKRKQKQLRYLGSAGFSAIVLLGALGSAHAAETQDEAVARLEALKQQVAEQSRRLEALKRSVAEEEASLKVVLHALGLETLAVQRGGGTQTGAPAQVSQNPPSENPGQVGQAPEREGRPPAIAPIFEQPGVLTQKGKFVLEPSLQYSYSSSNRVALVGYTIIPALLIGVIDVREVKRNTFTPALTTRFGVTNRLEVEARLPYVYRSDTSVGREVLQGEAVDTAFNSSGQGIGDVELTARYQFNDGGTDNPYYIGSLRFKSRTGKDPFEVMTTRTIVGLRNGVQTELPTGSGFYGLQPTLTVLLPSDPAVFFGSLSYLHSFKRDNVIQTTDTGDQNLGSVQPGGIIGFNFGMGLAINEKSSFSIGYDHASVGKTKQNGQYALDAVRLQLGSLLLGYSYRVNDKRTVNVSLGAGLTRDTPDVTLTFRMPVGF